MKKILLAIGVASVVGAAADAVVAQGVELGAAFPALSRPINVSVQKGMRDGASELGLRLRETDSGDKNDKQLNDVQDLLAQGVKGLLVVPIDSGTAVAYVKMARQAGVPIVGVMTPFGKPDLEKLDVAYPGLAAYVAWDDVDAGRTVGRAIGEAFKPLGRPLKVGVLEGRSGATSVYLRMDGFKTALDATGVPYKIVASQPADWTQDKGESVCQNMITANPDLDVIFSMSDEMSVGCARALKAGGGKVGLYSVGGSVKGIELLKKGEIVATACIKPSTVGHEAMRVMKQQLDGNFAMKGKTILLPTPLVTKANVEECIPEW